MKRLLIPLLAAIALPTAVNANVDVKVLMKLVGLEPKIKN